MSKSDPSPRPPSPPKLDDVDRKIIETLRFNARISNAMLAKAARLSESATLERVRRLERSGVIVSYNARVCDEALGRNVSAVVLIRLGRYLEQDFDDFVAAMKDLPEVLDCFQVMGATDFVAHVAAKDAEGLDRFLSDKVRRLRAVERTESMFVLKSPKRCTDPPRER